MGIEVHLGNEFGSTWSDDTVVDVGGTSGVFSWLDGSERECAFVFGEHFCPVLEVWIRRSVVFVLGVVVATCGAGLPDFDDDIVEWFVIGIDDDALDDDLFAVGDGRVLGEASQVSIEVFLFIDIGDGVKGAFGLGCGGWKFAESFFDGVEGQAASEGGLLEELSAGCLEIEGLFLDGHGDLQLVDGLGEGITGRDILHGL